MPHYKFDDFKNACANNPGSVIPFTSASDGACDEFGLKTTSQLLKFISNGGLENLSFQNKNEWDNNPHKDKPIIVDAYEFQSLNKLGYIAFMYNADTKKWIIKSFKLSENRNLAMYHALDKAGLIQQENKRG